MIVGGGGRRRNTCTVRVQIKFMLLSWQTIKKHLVFVYGTLKRGEPNHSYLQVKDNGYAKFVSQAKTVEKYPLVIASKYNIPFLLYNPGVGENVKGEIYEVDDHVLSQLDILENHPSFYVRETESVQIIPQNEESNDSKEELKCWIYFLKQFKPSLLSMPFLVEYQSEGNHAQPYLPPHKRTPGYQVATIQYRQINILANNGQPDGCARHDATSISRS
ncbi:hypothetical protein RUM44_011371 [Polyplax serrata]|uniref:Gamma-glutamylcyclotransferase family protein n=1 Tax=Polyplax serrata TaxID=468196 RepID=A0ABR1AQG9_POLSC